MTYNVQEEIQPHLMEAVRHLTMEEAQSILADIAALLHHGRLLDAGIVDENNLSDTLGIDLPSLLPLVESIKAAGLNAPTYIINPIKHKLALLEEQIVTECRGRELTRAITMECIVSAHLLVGMGVDMSAEDIVKNVLSGNDVEPTKTSTADEKYRWGFS